MIVRVGTLTMDISSQMLTDALTRDLPPFLRPTGDGSHPLSRNESLMRSAVKGFLPLLVGIAKAEIGKRHLPIVPPDLSCPEARQDAIGYCIRYLLNLAVTFAEAAPWEIQGAEQEGRYVVTGIVPAAPIMVAAESIPAGQE